MQFCIAMIGSVHSGKVFPMWYNNIIIGRQLRKGKMKTVKKMVSFFFIELLPSLLCGHPDMYP